MLRTLKRNLQLFPSSIGLEIASRQSSNYEKGLFLQSKITWKNILQTLKTSAIYVMLHGKGLCLICLNGRIAGADQLVTLKQLW